LFYFLVVFLPFGVCSPILFVEVWVLISAIDPTFFGAGSMVVLSTRVQEGFLLVIIVLPLLATLCGHPYSLDGSDYSFDPFSTVFWFSYGGIVLWLV
jgi:ABC-type multidrug transport system permease subunit